MKVKALADLSGRPGDRAVDDVFEVSAAYGKQLIADGLVVEVPDEQPPARAPAAATPAKSRAAG